MSDVKQKLKAASSPEQTPIERARALLAAAGWRWS
jgi:hypothetical protein